MEDTPFVQDRFLFWRRTCNVAYIMMTMMIKHVGKHGDDEMEWTNDGYDDDG